MDGMDIIGTVLLVGFLSVVLWGIGKALGISAPPWRDPLADPRVEWEASEQTSSIGDTEWAWEVRVGDKRTANRDWMKWTAISHARAAARRMLGEGGRVGKTRLCPLCGKPGRVGQETDTEECARLLKIAREELANLPEAQL